MSDLEKQLDKTIETFKTLDIKFLCMVSYKKYDIWIFNKLIGKTTWTMEVDYNGKNYNLRIGKDDWLIEYIVDFAGDYKKMLHTLKSKIEREEKKLWQ